MTVKTNPDCGEPSAAAMPAGAGAITDICRQLERAGLPRMRVHDLRHGTASLLRAQGADLRMIMEILGHSQIGFTANLCTHLSPQVKRVVATSSAQRSTGELGYG